MHALETRHSGYRFRSRLEARWAVFFETANVPYEYEKEGFDLGEAGWYLPDFWIPYYWHHDAYPEGTPPIPGIWVEIKPSLPTTESIAKIEALARATQHCVYLVAGNVGNGAYSVWKMHPRREHAEPIPEATFLFYLDTATPGPALMAWNEEVGFTAGAVSHAAYVAARSARFERGAP